MGTGDLKSDPFRTARDQMVNQQLARRGILDKRVLDAMRAVPRHLFVPDDAQNNAYADQPLSIGHGQTISQPYMVACMIAQLELSNADRVLEIGTGSGYQTAILSHLAGTVYSMERVPELAAQAQERLDEAGFSKNVYIKTGDGSRGWPEHAPYDAIIVSAGSPKIPESLKQQLADGGRLIIPVGERYQQRIIIITRHQDQYDQHEDVGCVFVPLIGQEGW